MDKLEDSRSTTIVSLALLRSTEEAIQLSVKSGKGTILKTLSSNFKNQSIFKTVIIPTAVQLFKKLIENRDKYENKSEAKVKAKLTPFFLCIMSESSLFDILLEDYDKLPVKARKIVDDKFESLVKAGLKSRERVVRTFEKLVIDIEETTDVKSKAKLVLKTMKALRSKKMLLNTLLAVMQEFFENKLEMFLKLFMELESRLIFKFIFRSYKITETIDRVMEIRSTWNLDLSSFILGLVFTEIDSKDTDILLNLLNEFLDENQSSLNTTELNNLLVKKISKTERGFPSMAAFLSYYLAKLDRKNSKSIDSHTEVFKIGIQRESFDDSLFWKHMLKFCWLDRIIAEETISVLLPDGVRKRFFDEYNKGEK